MKTLLESIVPSQIPDIEVAGWDGARVKLAAPRAKNLNEKGTPFAGSIDAMLNPAGWNALTPALHDAGIEAEVMITRSETEYTCPVRGDMSATAEIPSGERPRRLDALMSKAKCRIPLHCRVSTGDASISAQFAVFRPFKPNAEPAK